jgi:hypothetical protein
MKSNKHIFIDESGSNNTIFVVCLIIFNDLYKVSEVVNRINKFKINLFKRENIELHFNKESLNTKRSFFRLWSKKDFIIKYLETNDTLTFSNQIINTILRYRHVANNSIIFLDGFKSRCYNRKILSEIKKGLKRYGVNIKSIKYIDSKGSNLIQLADMCAGCIRRKIHKNSKEDEGLFNLIKLLIDN